MTAAPPTTLIDLLRNSCEQHNDCPALGMAMAAPLTYKELYRRVTALAALLHKQGIKKGDKIAILSENSPQWGIAYFASQFCGAVAVPILPDFPGNDVRHIITETRAKVLFTTEKQLPKIYELMESRLENIVTLDDCHDPDCPGSHCTFSSLLADALDIPEKKRQKPTATTSPDDLASIIYTSGTSGHSKAVMLSHKNLCANTHSASTLIPQITPEWTFLSILPMSHTYEFTIGFLLPLHRGCRVAYAGKRPTPTILQRICKAERPHAMCVVPMIMEKIYKKRVLATLKEKKVLGRLCRLDFIRRKIMIKIGNKLLDFFGGRLQLMAIGGAALNHETELFLAEAQMPYVVGYGLTESAPLLAGGPLFSPEIPIGSTGRQIPGVELKIVNPNDEGIGEIMGRGDNIMGGYYQDEQSTQATIDPDGWLATGDLGRIDDKGFLHILGRSKSVIVLSSGENVYPEAIEDKINSYECVADSLVVENNNRLEARVYLDQEVIDRDSGTQSQPERHDYIEMTLKAMQQTINKQLPPYAKISGFVEQEDPFTKTATHKIKRYLYQ
ncbi:MAG: AMP-binding protein [Thermodesulfobacteriota bacterium]